MLFIIPFVFGITAYAVTCSDLVSSQTGTPSIMSQFEPEDKFAEAFGKWINKKADEHAKHNYKSDKNRDRWQVLMSEMSPHFRELMMNARPDFFKDQRLPTPLELTAGMERIYLSKKIPRSKWKLPGVVLKNKKSGEVIFKNYSELRSWPSGFEVLTGHLPSQVFAKSLKSGVLPLSFTAEIEERFDTFVYYHDLNHLASFTNAEYLNAIDEFLDYMDQRLKTSTRPEILADDLLGPSTAYDLFEEFQFLPAAKHSEVKAFIAKFNGLSKIELGPGTPEVMRWNLKDIIPLDIKTKWTALEQRATQNQAEIQKLGLNVYVTPIEKLPKNLKLERLQIRKEFQELYKYAESIANEMDDLYKTNILKLGAAAGDVFSYRADNYAMSYRTGHTRFAVMYRLREGLERYRIPKFTHFEEEVAGFIAEMVQFSQKTPEVYVKEVMRKGESYY